MISNSQPKDFMFTETCDKSIHLQMDKVLVIENLLNENLKIRDYTNTLSGIFMIYQSLAPGFAASFPMHEHSICRRKTKVVEIYTVLDYNTVVKASETEMLKLLVETYLRGIQQYIKQKDFATERFCSDVKRLLL